jgi:hypothetical protein
MLSARASAAALAFALTALFAVQVWITDLAYRREATFQDLNAWHAAAMFGTGVLQTLALFAVYRLLHARREDVRAIVVGGAAAMSILALSSANTYPDPLAYMGYAKLTHFGEAYAPPRAVFPPAFHQVNARWGTRLVPLDYGPLWLAFDRFAVGRARSVPEALFILRAFNLAALAVLFAAILRLGAGPAPFALAALNPALYYYYVVQAHNDLMPIVLVVLGMLVARRNLPAGAFVAGCAGLMKVTFGLVALVAAPPHLGRTRAVAYLAVIVAVVCAGSMLFGGSPYLHALGGIGGVQLQTAAGTQFALRFAVHAFLTIVTIAATLAALFFSTFVAPAAYAFAGVAPIIEPNYLGWGVPYALRSPGFAAFYFATLPAIAHLIDAWFPLDPRSPYAIQDAFGALLAIACAVYVLLSRKNAATRVLSSALDR